MNRVRVAIAVTALAITGVFASAADSAVTRVEAEALPHSGPCWSVLNWALFSGGAASNCYATAQPLRWTVSTTSSDVVRL